jgi:uncharacterized repeat protein (TIGR03803 family)
MKMKKLLFTIAVVISTLSSFAQTQLYGTTSYGGANSLGAIFKTDGSGDNVTVQHSFVDGEPGYPLYSKMVQTSDGMFYGVTGNGGANGFGVIFQYNSTTNTWTKKYDFDGTANGSYPYGSLMLASDGMLYGMTSSGGANGMGVIFQYNPTTNTYTKKFDFDAIANGSNPYGSLMQASDGMLYGMTSQGGANAAGVLFHYNLTTNTYTKKFDFDGTANGSFPNGALMQAADGMLYGMTRYGGANELGVLFQYNPASNIYTKKFDFDGLLHGSRPVASLIQATDGMLYGTTNTGGVSDSGVIFQYNPVANTCTRKFNFGGAANGSSPYCTLLLATDGKLYGMTADGGAGIYMGVIFQFNIATNTYTKKFDFNGTANGNAPYGSLMQAADGMIYGMTTGGGAYNYGVIFQYNPVLSACNKKYDFGNNPHGNVPFGSLMQATDGKLYGMTRTQGQYNVGVIYQYDPATNIYTKKFDFDNTTNGGIPRGALMQASDGKLYGMANSGGANALGVLFQYDPVANTFTKKFDFDGTANGSLPYGALMQATDGKLYGTTSAGGANNLGVLFQYNPSTNAYTKKFDFDGTANGSAPFGNLMQATDGKLYGMTTAGGANGFGVIFQYDPVGNNFVKKFDFNGASNGSSPYGSLIQANDGMFYGLTYGGGINALGVLFQYNSASNTCINKIDFEGTTNGSYPWGTLLQASDGNLYGVTRLGGANSKGVLFHYNTSSSTLTKNFDFDGTNGANPVYVNLIEIIDPIVGIIENTDLDNINIYPNPANDILTVEGTELIKETILSVYNLQGQLLLKQTVKQAKEEINISGLAKGIYLLKVSNRENIKVKKFVKE